jgi:hypothetical protein
MFRLIFEDIKFDAFNMGTNLSPSIYSLPAPKSLYETGIPAAIEILPNNGNPMFHLQSLATEGFKELDCMMSCI